MCQVIKTAKILALEKMTKSEMLCLMVGGMATIAGGVLAAFIAC